MSVIKGADGGIKINLGDGSRFIANTFRWNAKLRREMLRQTTQADDFEKRTAGIGDWTGSLSFYMQLSDDTSIAQSGMQLIEHVMSNTGDDLKASIELVLQRWEIPADYDTFNTSIKGAVSLTGTVVIGDMGFDCEDPERPVIATASWEADGPLTPVRSDLLPEPE